MSVNIKVKKYQCFDDFAARPEKDDVNTVNVIDEEGWIKCDLLTDCKRSITAVNRFFSAVKNNNIPYVSEFKEEIEEIISEGNKNYKEDDFSLAKGEKNPDFSFSWEVENLGDQVYIYVNINYAVRYREPVMEDKPVKYAGGNHTEKTMNKIYIAMKKVSEQAVSGEDLHVSISNANSKMGPVSSVSLEPVITCPTCCLNVCARDCYALKIQNIYPAVQNAYARNTWLAINDPNKYWHEVEEGMKAVRYFRFHVSGDIINERYMDRMIYTIDKNRFTETLAFTKRFKIVNNWIDINGSLPGNSHLLLSGWKDFKPDNPHNLPETTVYENEADIQDTWKQCGGNCFECAMRGVGCWTAKAGDVIAFKKH